MSSLLLLLIQLFNQFFNLSLLLSLLLCDYWYLECYFCCCYAVVSIIIATAAAVIIITVVLSLEECIEQSCSNARSACVNIRPTNPEEEAVVMETLLFAACSGPEEFWLVNNHGIHARCFLRALLRTRRWKRPANRCGTTGVVSSSHGVSSIGAISTFTEMNALNNKMKDLFWTFLKVEFLFPGPGSSCSGVNLERLTWLPFDALWCSEGEGAAYHCQGQLKNAG